MTAVLHVAPDIRQVHEQRRHPVTISTGIYRFPPERAARIAVGTAAAEITGASGIKRVVFCCFSADVAAHHRDAFATLGLA